MSILIIFTEDFSITGIGKYPDKVKFVPKKPRLISHNF